MANPKKTPWIPIVVGIIAAVVVLGIALVGGVAYYISRNVHVRAEFISSESAEAQFAAARQRFSGQTALIEMPKHGEPIIHRAAEDAHAKPIEVIHAMVYSPDSRKLVNLNIPMWLLRMTPGKRFSFLHDDMDFDSDRIRLTIEDLEHHGPGLILDQEDRRGARVLVWAE